MANPLYNLSNINTIVEQSYNVVDIYKKMGLDNAQAQHQVTRDLYLIITKLKKQIREQTEKIIRIHT